MASVLIVEDNELNLQLMETILSANGFDFTSATTGEASVQLVKEQDFCLALMDLQLPDIDGYEALAKIRLIKSQQELPVIAITGNTTMADQKKVMSAGFDAFLKKPFRIDDLLEVVQEHLKE